MLNERKSWSTQEDTMLTQIYNQIIEQFKSHSANWNSIARKLKEAKIGPDRSGKQCRQRWYNQLDPLIARNIEWSNQQRKQLLQLHEAYGNRWSTLSKYFQGRTDHSIKNYFNSSLRKGLRILNSYIAKNRKFKQFRYRNIKSYKNDLLTKILIFCGKIVCEKTIMEQYCTQVSTTDQFKIAREVYEIASEIKRSLINLEDYSTNKQEYSKEFYCRVDLFENLIQKIHLLNSICKKRKQKQEKQKKCRRQRSLSIDEIPESITSDFGTAKMKLCMKAQDIDNDNFNKSQCQIDKNQLQKIIKLKQIRNNINNSQMEGYRVHSQRGEAIEFSDIINQNLIMDNDEAMIQNRINQQQNNLTQYQKIPNILNQKSKDKIRKEISKNEQMKLPSFGKVDKKMTGTSQYEVQFKDGHQEIIYNKSLMEIQMKQNLLIPDENLKYDSFFTYGMLIEDDNSIGQMGWMCSDSESII